MTEHGGHHPSLGDLLYPAVNFAIFVYVLAKYLRGPVQEFFRARTARLREALQAGAKARAEAQALRAELARDVADLPALRERMRADLRATAEREGDTIRRHAQQAADRIRTEARQLAEHEFAAARLALRIEVTEETIRQATAILRDALNPADRDRLVRDFIDRAGSST